MRYLKAAACLVGGFAIVGALLWHEAANPAVPLASFAVKIDLEKGHGSGVHIGHGYVLTAAHVADAGAPKVVLDNGTSRDADVLWINKAYDVALLRVSEFADIDERALSCAPLTVGTSYVAYGNPGDLDFVSASGKVVGRVEKRAHWNMAAVVDGAMINGMSGGPVVSAGKVVGISVGTQALPVGGMFPSYTGFGFVVPGSAICGLMAR